MKIPVIRGVIDRRILVNYHVDLGVLASLLPAPFRPKVIRGAGMVGICLIRLKQLRPSWLPARLGISSENAAHRAAVDWDDHGVVREGVYVRRRDTNSWLNSLAGGRLFPGIHHHARFTVEESADRLAVALRSDDEVTSMSVRSRRGDRLPTSSVFRSLEEASTFFQAGSLGYSATSDPARFQGLELRCQKWRVEPLDVEEVCSSFFDDVSQFPKGSIEFDSALLMRNIEHEWHGRSALCCVPSIMPDSTSDLAIPAVQAGPGHTREI
ncbi:MAG TPA: DUF2071 domain-containing protein [Planctomycetaceae bacterium]|jgi:hypothetical protein